MPKNLVIVESPSKANTIKAYLGANYKVMASVGHVRDLPKSTLGVDIENNFTPKYINIRGKAPLINDLKKEAKHADKIYLATDPDREGEAISWHLATALNIPVEQTKRITFNEITKTAVKNAIKEPRIIDMDLVNSQQARRILDRIVGYKLSPFLWQNVKSGLSAGRVQSVATRIIVEREEAIRKFVPQEYWTIDTLLETPKGKSFTAKFFGDAKTKKKIDLKTEGDSKKIIAAVKNSPFNVVSVNKSVKNKNPAPPFITSTLQQEAAQKLGFQIQRTMKIAQELYEGVNIGSENGGTQGLITYMRTDSTRVAAEAVSAAKSFINEKYGENYYPDKPHVFKSKGDAQDAHEAVRPANPSLEPDKIKSHLSADQYKLYKLIWSRFIASQMASAQLDTMTVDIESAGYLFRASGYTIKFQGYMAVYEESVDSGKNDDEPSKTKLPDIKEKDILKLLKITPAQHFTEPPPRFTEATLVNFFKDKGIGRPSTYLSIITTIINRGYVVREKKSLRPTPLGETTTHLMIEYFPDIVNYEFTAQMEDELDNIEHGQLTITDVLGEFYHGFETNLDKANQSVSKDDIKITVEETDIICDKCGSKMVVKHGRYGKFAACPNYPECKNTKPLTDENKEDSSDSAKVEKTDIKCELCGKDMIIRRGRYGNFYACSDYPTCKNTKPMAKDIGVPCPLCGAKLLSKQSKKKIIYYSCEKFPDCDFSSWDMPTNEKCPKCGKMLFRKKGKPLMICHDTDCGYKIDIPVEDVNESENEHESD
jgi:DNA topoisomerase I, bacterial